MLVPSNNNLCWGTKMSPSGCPWNKDKNLKRTFSILPHIGGRGSLYVLSHFYGGLKFVAAFSAADLLHFAASAEDLEKYGRYGGRGQK